MVAIFDTDIYNGIVSQTNVSKAQRENQCDIDSAHEINDCKGCLQRKQW